MRILITTCGGVVKGIKGWTEYALSKELIKKGHDVTVLTSSTVSKLHEAKNEETIDGISVRRFNPVLPGSFFYMLRKDWDVVNAHFPGHTASISSYAALRRKVRSVPFVHNVMGLYHDPYLVEDIQDPLGKPIRYKNMQNRFPLNPLRLRNWFSHLTLFNSDIVGALTEWEKSEIKKYGVDEARILNMPVGVSLDLYKKKGKTDFKKKHGIDGEMVIFVGQPIRRKGPEYLIKSIPLVARKHPEAKFVFIGYKGNKQVEDMTKGLEDRIKFLGFVPEEEKIAAMREASCFAFPTLYEGFGIVFLEAMAAGCPIVTTRVAGVPEVVSHGKTGLLVEPKNEKQLAQAITKTLDSKNLRRKFSNNGKKAVRKYDWKVLADTYVSAYEKAMRR